jgi:hypothetical protein
MAETPLGPGAEVVALDDLAHNGQEQALVVNRLAVGLGDGVSGVPLHPGSCVSEHFLDEAASLEPAPVELR